MFIIYGSTWYGRVHARGGEYIATQFIHLYFLPLIPHGSTHFVNNGQTLMGRDISLSLRSVLAAYLRWWGPLVGLILYAAGNILQGAILLGFYLLSWSWYWTRVPLEERSWFWASGLLGGRLSREERERRRVEALWRKLQPQLQAQHAQPREKEPPV